MIRTQIQVYTGPEMASWAASYFILDFKDIYITVKMSEQQELVLLQTRLTLPKTP